MHIPFTKYDVKVSRRGISFLDRGRLLSFADWSQGITFGTSTPIMEEVYSTIASEFAKIDLRHVIKKDGYEYRNDKLNYVVSERPNPYQTKYDFLFTMAYQRFKYGNALAILERDKNGFVTRIDPVNVNDYLFGNGYQIDEDTILLKFKNVRTNKIELINYEDIVHLRLNPNNIFVGDLFNGMEDSKPFINLIDAGLNSLISELKNNGTVRGIIQVGSSAMGLSKTMANQETKISKQEEIVDRIKATKGGILVLDAGEEWKSLSSPFESTSTKDIDNYINLLLQFNGINKAVVEGTATEEQMEVFFSKTIVPLIEQFISEINYKTFSSTAITQGHRIEYYRNPFEFVSITKAIDVAYKSIQDTTRNERREMIYKLPPDPSPESNKFMDNKNFENTKGEDDE